MNTEPTESGEQTSNVLPPTSHSSSSGSMRKVIEPLPNGTDTSTNPEGTSTATTEDHADTAPAITNSVKVDVDQIYPAATRGFGARNQPSHGAEPSPSTDFSNRSTIISALIKCLGAYIAVIGGVTLLSLLQSGNQLFNDFYVALSLVIASLQLVVGVGLTNKKEAARVTYVYLSCLLLLIALFVSYLTLWPLITGLNRMNMGVLSFAVVGTFLWVNIVNYSTSLLPLVFLTRPSVKAQFSK